VALGLAPEAGLRPDAGRETARGDVVRERALGCAETARVRQWGREVDTARTQHPAVCRAGREAGVGHQTASPASTRSAWLTNSAYFSAGTSCSRCTPKRLSRSRAVAS